MSPVCSHRYMLWRLSSVLKGAGAAYQDFQFPRVFQVNELQSHAAVTAASVGVQTSAWVVNVPNKAAAQSPKAHGGSVQGCIVHWLIGMHGSCTCIKHCHPSCSSTEPAQVLVCLQLLRSFAITDLSNFYLDVAKDRLYVRAVDDPDRRYACDSLAHAAFAQEGNYLCRKTKGQVLSHPACLIRLSHPQSIYQVVVHREAEQLLQG